MPKPARDQGYSLHGAGGRGARVDEHASDQGYALLGACHLVRVEVLEPVSWSTAAQGGETMSIPSGPAVGGSGTGQGRNNTIESRPFLPGRAVLPNLANEVPEPDCWSTAAVGVDGGDAAVGWSGTGSAAVCVDGGEAAVTIDRFGSLADLQSDRWES